MRRRLRVLALLAPLALVAAAPGQTPPQQRPAAQETEQPTQPRVMQVGDWIRLLPAPITPDDYVPATGAPGVSWPVRGITTQPFGCTGYVLEHPTTDCPSGFHSGLDIADPQGTPVRASAAGRAYPLQDPARYGNHVIVQHLGGYATVYAHMVRFNVSWGQPVQTGDVIGFVGTTGNSSGPHLHFEVRFASSPMDPMPYLDGSPPDPGPEPAGWPGAPRDDWRGIR
jgi:murein DD-endopeptidase MepM/ murein hydrolase activator NlpD